MAAKAVLASLALGFLNWVGVSFWPVVIFLGVMFAIYLSEPPERRALRSSFWLLSIFSILGIAAVSFLSGYFLIGLMTAFLILFFGLSLFFIFGLINLLFKDKTFVYNLLNAAVLAYFFLLVFYLMPGFSGDGSFNIILWFFRCACCVAKPSENIKANLGSVKPFDLFLHPPLSTCRIP